MNYADLHCDTPYELFIRGEKLKKASTDVDLTKLSFADKYLQLAAYCAPPDKTDSEAYRMFFEVADCFKNELSENGLSLCLNGYDISANSRAFVLTAEDARILEGDLSHIDTLYTEGVRVITPLWGGVTCIGGSHEADSGLTPFGKDAVRRCAELGMILDISHASETSADDILDICENIGTPVMASHSCSFTLNPHSRNLRDRHAKRIADLGGVIGVNLYPPHLTGKSASLADAVHHISYFVSVAGETSVSLGCDFDGIGIYPEDGKNVGCLPSLLCMMSSSGISSSLAEKIIYQNAYDFLTRSI